MCFTSVRCSGPWRPDLAGAGALQKKLRPQYTGFMEVLTMRVFFAFGEYYDPLQQMQGAKN